MCLVLSDMELPRRPSYYEGVEIEDEEDDGDMLRYVWQFTRDLFALGLRRCHCVDAWI